MITVVLNDVTKWDDPPRMVSAVFPPCRHGTVKCRSPSDWWVDMVAIQVHIHIQKAPHRCHEHTWQQRWHLPDMTFHWILIGFIEILISAYYMLIIIPMAVSSWWFLVDIYPGLPITSWSSVFHKVFLGVQIPPHKLFGSLGLTLE